MLDTSRMGLHPLVEPGQYLSIRYTERLADIGAAASVGSVADSYAAMADALNGTFKAELIEMQGPWRDFDQVERAIFQWVTWYNEERLHSALDYVPPAEYDAARDPERAPQRVRTRAVRALPGECRLAHLAALAHNLTRATDRLTRFCPTRLKGPEACGHVGELGRPADTACPNRRSTARPPERPRNDRS